MSTLKFKLGNEYKPLMNDIIKWFEVFLGAYPGDTVVQELKNRLTKSVNHIDTLYTKNTVYHPMMVDAIAFFEMLRKDISQFSGKLNSVELELKGSTYFIVAEYYEQAMNPNGFGIGGHSWKAKWKLWKKDNFGILGLPSQFSGYVVLPFVFEDYDIETPDAEELDPIDSHDDDCEFKGKDEWDQCDCADMIDLYTPPHEIDADYFWTETNSHIESLFYSIYKFEKEEFPEGVFDKETRTWAIGDVEMKLDGPKFNIYDELNY